MTQLLKNDDLFREALIKPASCSDAFITLSGFATPGMVMTHREPLIKKELSIKMNVFVGMVSFSGISAYHHENFKRLMTDYTDTFSCSYLYKTVHSKLFLWLKNGKPIISFCGSANYTTNGFLSTQEELLTECNPNEAYEYIQHFENESIYCNHPEVDDKFCITDRPYKKPNTPTKQNKKVIDTIRLPLFSERTGKIHEKAGLNWGQRTGREPNQAYIPVPRDKAQSGFFPERGKYFSVLTDDGIPFVCTIEQEGDKALSTPQNNSLLGEYFRNKLNVPLGKKVSLDDLDRYGSRYVTFSKIDDDEYLMSYEKDTK